MMEYHEIGERFEYDGVMLEVKEGGNCKCCYFYSNIWCNTDIYTEMYCNHITRKDGKQVFFDKVEKQANTKCDDKKDNDIENTINTMGVHTPSVKTDTIVIIDIIDKLKETILAKNEDYGNAFSEMYSELGIDYAYGKLREKINRIKTLRNQPNLVENEGLEDALLDTAGYAILTLVELKKRKQ